jgi:hypothetical protein
MPLCHFFRWHNMLDKPLKTCYIRYIVKEVLQMINTYLLHDDYESFASKYLGIDYEDYVNLQLSLPDEDEIEEVEYEVPVF